MVSLILTVVLKLGGAVVGVGDDDPPAMGQAVATLAGNWPNPFNIQTTIAFELSREMLVDLAVYDTAGRLVAMLLHRELGRPGRNEIVWRGRDQAGRVVGSGMYYYRLEAESYRETRRMMLIN